MSYERPSRKAIGCMYLASGIGDVIVLAILVALWVNVVPHEWVWARISYYVLFAACVLDLFVFPYFRYCRYRYRITEDAM